MALNLENNDLKTIAGVENLRGLRSLNVRNNDVRTCGAALHQCTELADIDLHSNDIDDFRRYILLIRVGRRYIMIRVGRRYILIRVGGDTRPPLERVVPRTGLATTHAFAFCVLCWFL